MRLHLCISFLIFVCSWTPSGFASPHHVFPSKGSTEVLSKSSDARLSKSAHDMATTRRSRPKRWLHANQNLFAINYYLGAGWSCYYNSLDFIYPGSAVAEEDLERFLSGVLSLAGAVWANQPDRTVRVASLGQLILKVTSNEPIPWQWIHGYLLGAVRPVQSPHLVAL